MSDSAKASAYVRDRVEQYRSWYDTRARSAKLRYLTLRVIGLTSAVIVIPTILCDGLLIKMLGLGLSVVVVLSIALDAVLRLREQWENYRYTEQYLDREKHLFQAGAAHYHALDEATAFKHFVERVEWAIGAENSTTLTTLALAPDVRTTDTPMTRSKREES